MQHVEYVPFGEVFIEERNNVWNTPYRFNAKELDEETGLYYYGARYYDPRVSVWLSTDPLQEKYPSVTTYAYCLQKPINVIDTDGRKIIFINGYLGFGSPYGGKQYWSNSFISGAHNFFTDYTTPFFTDIEHNALSSASDRHNKGYNYAKDNYTSLIEGMSEDESFKLVSHSMGGAFSTGIKEFLEEQGWNVEFSVFINTYQSDKIKISKDDPTFIIDYQNTNDPVLFWLDQNFGKGKIKKS